MRFYTTPHRYYCGIDLHARRMYIIRSRTALLKFERHARSLEAIQPVRTLPISSYAARA